MPLVPPWVPDPGVVVPIGPSAAESEEGVAAPVASPPQLAPPARFRGARTSLGKFARSGSSGSLRRGLGSYIRTGLGGARTATRRLGGTAVKAGVLYGTLDALRRGDILPVELGISAAELAGRPVREAADYIAQAISPSDGSQDAEASRESMSQALRDLVAAHPDADLTALAEAQIDLVIERFVGHDICRRVELDVGSAVFEKAPDPATAISRLNQMHRYIHQCVAASFRKLRSAGQSLSAKGAERLAESVLRDTFDVFEGYVR